MVSAVTVTEMPGEANVAAEPVARGAPEQSLVAYRFTVEFVSALPMIFGVVDCAGDSGSVEISEGSSGASVSLT